MARCRAKGVNAHFETVIACYSPPPEAGVIGKELQWRQALGAALESTLTAPLAVLAGDFNARHRTWDPGIDSGDSLNWRRGDTVDAVVREWSLHVASAPSFPRASGVTTAIDLLITSEKLSSKVIVSKFDKKLTDHYALHVTLGELAGKRPAQWRRVWAWPNASARSPRAKEDFVTALEEAIGVYGVGSLPTGTRSMKR